MSRCFPSALKAQGIPKLKSVQGIWVMNIQQKKGLLFQTLKRQDRPTTHHWPYHPYPPPTQLSPLWWFS